ncbi:MAG: oligopeptide transport system substrate-binding protein, partial [Actinomycetota bacterium]|nr:oligopeptide transport system substrate-binding protein [Actinomycetota bacterium]
MSRPRRRRGLVALALLATACSGAHATPFRSADPQARIGGVLRVGILPPGSVDPGNDYEPAGDLVIRTMCDTLLTTNPRTGEVRPGLVESWVVAADGAKLVLRLRKDLRFSDGSPLTSADVTYSLSRIASADFASARADALELVAGFAQVHGDAATDSDAERRELAGVRTTDNRTVEISLRRPYGDFLRVLTTGLTSPVSRRAADADPRAFARSPVCVGPYRLAEPFAPGATTLRLVRSKAYAPTDSRLTRGGAAYADEVSFRVFPTAAAMAAAGTELDVRAASPTDLTGVQTGPGPEIEYLGLPTDTGLFQDAKVRRALALALSREELVRRVFPSTRTPAGGFLPATAPGAPRCDALPPAGDVDAAVALLDDVGVRLRGRRVALVFNDELRNRELVTEVARQWKGTLGLVATPTPLTFSAFLTQGRAARGFGAPFRFSWSADDIDGYLTPLFSADAIGRDNLSRFSDPTIDQALKRRAWRAVDPADRALAYGRITDLLCEQMPMIPLTTSLRRYVVND